MSKRSENRNARLDAAELRVAHQMLDEIRSVLGIAGSDDPLTALRALITTWQIDKDNIVRLNARLADRAEEFRKHVDADGRRAQAMRDAGHELQRRNKDLQAILLLADRAVGDHEAVMPAEVRAWGMQLRDYDVRRDDPAVFESRLPLKVEDRLAVKALLGGYQFRRQLAELAASGALRDVDLPS